MNKVLRCLLVDDEPLARVRLKRLLDSVNNIQCVAEAENGEQAIRMLTQIEVDLVFLDISMPGISGLETAKQIRLLNKQCKIVFVTAHPEHALAAFDLLASGYLVKPLESNKLEALLLSLFPEVDTITYRVGNTLRKLLVDDILIAQADNKYTRLILENGHQALIEKTLKALHEEYRGYFVKIHRSTLVKRSAIRALEVVGQKHFVVLKHFPEKLEVSRRALTQLRADIV
ncbi:LytR/AlgR family response regulator transcription factor [Pseudoalteromonas sp. T1lg65]|uniref:LytR/AlgR family response regulator transcription factor n=1 Tax=Pseudoalteromonas sp. T1lg65 TaxID=2077101 RepID=UPI003F7ADCC8